MYTNGVLSLCHYALSLEGANADICPVEELVVRAPSSSKRRPRPPLELALDAIRL